uniref:Laminin, gamma 2 n=1 Tax=Amphilophus citrinellus TaxID=61819 RepID=A0A3Q0SDU6_AMPCI
GLSPMMRLGLGLCNGRSQYCLRDTLGLHCVDCQGNTEGRHCEHCKDGFYMQGAEESCSPCRCNLSGSISKSCDSRGRCSCKEGVTGDKCDRCPNGPIGPEGLLDSHFLLFIVFFSRQPRQDSGSSTLSCFCYGHSSRCSAQSGYSVHKITSTFTNGPEDWKVATMHGSTPDDINFRWSPKHQDLEVISENSLPVYLYAPDPYLGNQLLSYGQNLSFSLRLDRGVRYPSVNDVILEGGGLRVAASLGDLRSIVPCGQKISYSFRLDEQPSSKWRPQLSSFQFQTLLQNLTAIKIRATFGETGRGYLDNVQLVSALRGDGVPAHWVHTCSCPPGHEGEFCQRCSAGFKRSAPADGAFSPCEPCSCRGDSCDHTADCYSADETPADQSCSQGFYRDPRRPETCVRCPCPEDMSCSLPPGSLEPRCDACPRGATGPRCDVCQEGFYGDPSGVGGVQHPCRPCQCNGHIDVRVPGSCDRSSGECLKCVNNTRGQHCEDCVRGFYHTAVLILCPKHLCRAITCNCDVRHSESDQCDASGQCRCRAGFEGLRCQRSSCPACFTPIKAKKATAQFFNCFESAVLLLSLQKFNDLLDRVNSAKANTEGAIKLINRNTNELEDALKTLRVWNVASGGTHFLATVKILDSFKCHNVQRLSRKDLNALLGLTVSCFLTMSASTDQSGPVDERKLKQVEDNLAKAKSNIEDNLRPRLRDMEDKEAAHRRRLTLINQDINTILEDISNLEEILGSIPTGCYNSPPIEGA